jgi:peroxiredoxin
MEPREGTPAEGQGLVAGLIGREMPDLVLRSTDGTDVNFAKLRNSTVVFFYPYTGKPGHPDPEGWDSITGAHGSTPQALEFSNKHDQFSKLHVRIFGVSFQTTSWQREFTLRNQLRFSLVTDADHRLSTALGLATFRAGEADYLVRRTVVISDGIITHEFYPVPVPEQNAADVLRALQA